MVHAISDPDKAQQPSAWINIKRNAWAKRLDVTMRAQQFSHLTLMSKEMADVAFVNNAMTLTDMTATVTS